MVLALKVPRKNVRIVLLYTHFRGLLLLKISITGSGAGLDCFVNTLYQIYLYHTTNSWTPNVRDFR